MKTKSRTLEVTDLLDQNTKMKRAFAQNRQVFLPSLITISWPLNYHINTAGNQTRHRALFSVPANICMLNRTLQNLCFPGHFVFWILSEALKAVIVMQWCHQPTNLPLRINLKEVPSHWCSSSFSDTVCWKSSKLFGSATNVPSQLGGTNVAFGLQIKDDAGGINMRVCVWASVCCKPGKFRPFMSKNGVRSSLSYCFCLISSQRTHSLGISGLQFNVALCLSMKSWRNAIITSPNRHFYEMRGNNWEHKRGEWWRGAWGVCEWEGVDPCTRSEVQISFYVCWISLCCTFMINSEWKVTPV